MADLHTRTATFASLKCRSKCDIFAPKGRVKNKGKRAVFPYDKASSRKPCLSLSSSIVLLNHSVRQKQTAQSSLPPSQSNCSKQTSSNHKKADIFSLLSLHFFCALHFDLLFCKSDFETHQPYEQSH